MKKADLVSALATHSGTTQAAASAFLISLEHITKTNIQAGVKVVIPGVVTLTVKDQAARVGRNPATGAAVQIPAKRVVKAKPPADLAKVA